VERDGIAQHRLQPRVARGHEVRQDADARARSDQPMLHVDAGAAQLPGKLRFDLGKIVELGRVDMLRDIADEHMLAQIRGGGRGVVTRQIVGRGVKAEPVIGEPLRPQPRAAGMGEHHCDIRLAL